MAHKQEAIQPGEANKVEADKAWNKKLEDANKRSEKRKKTREEAIKDAQEKIAKKIEEKKE